MTVNPQPRTVRLNPDDDVVLAVDGLEPGMVVDGVTVADKAPRGHKLAVRDLAEGETIRKFGQAIGVALRPIKAGQWVHEHNCGMGDHDRDYRIGEDARPLPPAERAETFQGFRRAGGKVGTRNYVGVLTSVNCSASVARFVAREVERSGMLEDFPNVDGVIPLVHATGCGMAAHGPGFDTLKRSLWGYASNPNMAAVVMIGLGCEVFQIAMLKDAYGIEEDETFRTLTIQQSGGTRRAVEAGVAAVREMLPVAERARRETCPASELTLALQCGGSDGYSGLTANPALGAAADLLVRQGGTAILSETPEIYGAEHLLTRRAASREVGEKLLGVIRWWEDYAARMGGDLNNNPSPGNKAGGLTTILEKSLGAAMKGGTSPLMDVVGYAEPVTTKGLVFMDTPGFDPVSATGQVAGGANVLCFTTGRGSAYGCKPTPSIKLASTTDLFLRMRDDMDLNCGDVLDGVPLAEKGEEIFREILAVASGRRTRSECLGYGDAEFVPWQLGATM